MPATPRPRWPWMLLLVLGGVALGCALARSRRVLSDDDASVYSGELERMQDA